MLTSGSGDPETSDRAATLLELLRELADLRAKNAALRSKIESRP